MFRKVTQWTYHSVLIGIIDAYRTKHRFLSVVQLMVYISSTLFHNRYYHQLRTKYENYIRYFDIGCVLLSFNYYLRRIYFKWHKETFYTRLSLMSFVLSIMSYFKGRSNVKRAGFYHGMLHLLVIFSSFLVHQIRNSEKKETDIN